MDEKQKLQDLIHRYVMGDLSDSEREGFEKKIANDPALKAKVALQQEAYQLIKKAGPDHLKKRLQEMEKTVAQGNEDPPVRMLSNRRIWLAAASFLLIAFASWWIINASPKATTEELLATYMQPYRNPSNLRGEGRSILLRSQAAELYSNGDYNQAALIWDRLMMVEGGGTERDHFYMGISRLFSTPPKAEQAIRQLEIVLQSDNDYHQQSWWYIALAYLKTGKQEEARSYLEKLVEKGEYKKEEAEALLDSFQQ